MTKPVKIKGAKRLARRAATRTTLSPLKVRPVQQAQPMWATPPRILSEIAGELSDAAGKLKRMQAKNSRIAAMPPAALAKAMTDILSPVDGSYPKWRTEDGRAVPINSLSFNHLHNIITMLRTSRSKLQAEAMVAIRQRPAAERLGRATGAAVKNAGLRTEHDLKSAISCAWLMVLETEAVSRDPSYRLNSLRQGAQFATPTDVEKAAAPEVIDAAHRAMNRNALRRTQNRNAPSMRG